jgi:phage shock protein A
MALITRISRLFTADVNAVIDRLEEPDIVLKQALRDMQDSLAVTQNRVQQLRGQMAQLSEHHSHAERQLAQLDNELAACLDAQDDDLARNVIRRKLCIETSSQDLTSRDADLRRALHSQEQRLDEQSHELESLRQKIELLDLSPPGTNSATTPSSVSAEQVEIALLQEKQLREKQLQEKQGRQAS